MEQNNQDDRCRRKNEFGERLARIEEKLDYIISWQTNKDKQCHMCESSITSLKVEQGKQGVLVYLFSGAISAVVASVIGYVLKR